MSLTKKLLAFVCQVCPLCIVRRKFPRSAFARFMENVEKSCPFCKAYSALHPSTGKHKKKKKK